MFVERHGESRAYLPNCAHLLAMYHFVHSVCTVLSIIKKKFRIKSFCGFLSMIASYYCYYHYCKRREIQGGVRKSWPATLLLFIVIIIITVPLNIFCLRYLKSTCDWKGGHSEDRTILCHEELFLTYVQYFNWTLTLLNQHGPSAGGSYWQEAASSQQDRKSPQSQSRNPKLLTSTHSFKLPSSLKLFKSIRIIQSKTTQPVKIADQLHTKNASPLYRFVKVTNSIKPKVSPFDPSRAGWKTQKKICNKSSVVIYKINYSNSSLQIWSEKAYLCFSHFRLLRHNSATTLCIIMLQVVMDVFVRFLFVCVLYPLMALWIHCVRRL